MCRSPSHCRHHHCLHLSTIPQAIIADLLHTCREEHPPPQDHPGSDLPARTHILGPADIIHCHHLLGPRLIAAIDTPTPPNQGKKATHLSLCGLPFAAHQSLQGAGLSQQDSRSALVRTTLQAARGAKTLLKSADCRSSRDEAGEG